MQVIGAGFGRTGTMSLKAALEQLGFGPAFHMIDLVRSPADLPHWHEPAAIARAALIAVAPREGAPLPPALPFGPERIVRVDMPYIGVSSTELRQRARRGLSLRYLVPDAVAAYIREQGLYRPYS